jgi:hypothetical protein
MNRNNNDNFKENVFFSLDETSIEFDNEDIITNLLNDFDYKNQINDLTDKEIIDLMSYEYKINYNVKDLLLICEYYGIAKELKVQKFCKEMIIFFLIDFENDPLNNTIVLKRKKMWSYINMLKNDKFMKKYIIW